MSTCTPIVVTLSCILVILFVLCCVLVYKLRVCIIYNNAGQGFKVRNALTGKWEPMEKEFYDNEGSWEPYITRLERNVHGKMHQNTNEYSRWIPEAMAANALFVDKDDESRLPITNTEIPILENGGLAFDLRKMTAAQNLETQRQRFNRTMNTLYPRYRKLSASDQKKRDTLYNAFNEEVRHTTGATSTIRAGKKTQSKTYKQYMNRVPTIHEI